MVHSESTVQVIVISGEGGNHCFKSVLFKSQDAYNQLVNLLKRMFCLKRSWVEADFAVLTGSQVLLMLVLGPHFG